MCHTARHSCKVAWENMELALKPGLAVIGAKGAWRLLEGCDSTVHIEVGRSCMTSPVRHVCAQYLQSHSASSLVSAWSSLACVEFCSEISASDAFDPDLT